jgi:lipoprotein signal peptidase
VRPSDRLLLFAAPAVVLVAVDQVVKATVATPVWAFHHRSYGWVALSIAVLVGAFFLTLVPSRAVAVAAGVMSAGAIGNLISARLDGNWVPNPLVIGDYQRGIAFNLADVFFLIGNMLLMSALIVMLVRRRDRLAPPRAWERALLRQLRVGG